MGVRTQSRSTTAGTAGRRIGCNDHQSGPARPFSDFSGGLSASPSGHGGAGVDPAAQQFHLAFGERLAGRHLAVADFGEQQAVAGLAGATTTPASPPLSRAARVVRSRSPRALAGLWHLRQRRLQQRRDLLVEGRSRFRVAQEEEGGQECGSHGNCASGSGRRWMQCKPVPERTQSNELKPRTHEYVRPGLYFSRPKRAPKPRYRGRSTWCDRNKAPGEGTPEPGERGTATVPENCPPSRPRRRL